MRWVRRFWDGEGIWFCFELDQDGWVTRQIELQGPDMTPIAAASLSEWFTELDAGRIQRYQARFSVVAEQPVTADEIDDREPVPAGASEQLWQTARSHLEDELPGLPPPLGIRHVVRGCLVPPLGLPSGGSVGQGRRLGESEPRPTRGAGAAGAQARAPCGIARFWWYRLAGVLSCEAATPA